MVKNGETSARFLRLWHHEMQRFSEAKTPSAALELRRRMLKLLEDAMEEVDKMAEVGYQ